MAEVFGCPFWQLCGVGVREIGKQVATLALRTYGSLVPNALMQGVPLADECIQAGQIMY